MELRAFSTSWVAAAPKKKPLTATIPKTPATAYGRFLKDFFAREKDDYLTPEGKVSVSEIMTAVSSACKALPDSEKAPYQDAYKTEKRAFEAAYKEWYEGLSSADIKAIEAESGKELKLPGGAAARKQAELAEAEEQGKPPKPLTPFFEFLREFRESFDRSSVAAPSHIAIEMSKEGAAQWKALSDDVKQRFKTIAEEKSEAWKAWHHARGLEVPKQKRSKH